MPNQIIKPLTLSKNGSPKLSNQHFLSLWFHKQCTKFLFITNYTRLFIRDCFKNEYNWSWFLVVDDNRSGREFHKRLYMVSILPVFKLMSRKISYYRQLSPNRAIVVIISYFTNLLQFIEIVGNKCPCNFKLDDWFPAPNFNWWFILETKSPLFTLCHDGLIRKHIKKTSIFCAIEILTIIPSRLFCV